MKKLVPAVLVVVSTCFFGAIPAQAVPFGFANITNNDPTDAAIGEAQLFVDVTDAGGGLVLFTFINLGPEASSITNIYFDDGSLLAIATIDNPSGVDFSEQAIPANLPGGMALSEPFVATSSFSAESDPAVPANGVNPGESVLIYFSLDSGQTFEDVLAELNSGELRIGIHVQGYDGGGSESFVNTVAEPGPLVLLGLGLAGLAWFRRRRG